MKLFVGFIAVIGGLLEVSRYASATLCPVSLPQNSDPACTAIRNADLARDRKTFTLKVDESIHGFAMLNMTIPELAAVIKKDPFMRAYFSQYLQKAHFNDKIFAHYNSTMYGQEINDISEYLPLSDYFQSAPELFRGEMARLPSMYEEFIDDKPAWISDKYFAQQRLAGTNPKSLKRVSIPGEEPIGLDWNELKKTLNPDFDWDKAVQDALESDDVSLEDAIKQDLIYALRYEECDDLPRLENDVTDKDPRRTMWDFLSPIALFTSARRELVPVAIQMDHRPESDVFTPKDGGNWHIAKVNVQITDVAYSQLVEHLGKTHFLLEPFCVSLKRTLPDMHPLNQILKYHCREVIVPNTFGTPALVAENAGMSLLFACGNTGAARLIQLAHQSASWETMDFRRDIKKRGLDDKKLLPYFPYRDDGETILRVIERLVEKYVDLYYDDDQDIKNDVELQAYVNEVSLDGTGPDGGIGRIKGFPASVHTKGELCQIVSRIICHLSIHHAAINYGLSDYATYIPNQPTKLYNDTRVEPGTFSVYRLPNRLTSSFITDFSNRFSTFRFDSLFDYGNELQDTEAVNLVNKYYSHLMKVVQPRLQKENRKRKKRGHLTYPYLIPRWIPNGIQT